MTTPAFSFGSTGVATSRGTVSSGEAANEFWHPILPTTLKPASGYLLILNGWNLNRAMADMVGHDGTTATALQMLQMRAPRQPILPLVSQVGNGRIFRPGAKWRYRWLDSRTGQASGLSPIPDTEVNMGAETPVNGTTYLGQQAFFYLATADAPAHADTIQLFSNTTRQDDVWYLSDEAEIAGNSYVTLTDNYTDDELFFQEYVVSGSPSATPAGFTWKEGIMWPVVKAYLHPSGRVLYYGMRRFGKYGPSTLRVAVTEGSDLCTIEAGSGTTQRLVEPGRTGQRVRFYSALGTDIDDPTVYRLVKAESSNTFRVTPDIKVSTELAADATANWYFAIEDDRDARWTWMSEPNKPWLIDPLKVLAAGDDYDDGVMAWFSVEGRIYMQTRRRIYEAVGSPMDDPSTSTVFVPRAEEGMPGFDCGCETPFGWVFVHERRGVRVFDGMVVRPLAADGDPYADFPPQTQFANFEPSMIGECVVGYDDEHRVVLVSYVPSEQSTRKEVLAFDTTSRNWRGPYRDRISAIGHLRSTDSSDVFVTGDDFGNLMTREEQVQDVLPTTTGLTAASTLTGFLDERFLDDTANAFDDDGDERLRGSPIWLTRTSDSTLFFARIAGIVSGTRIETDGLPVDEDGNAWNASDVLGAYEIGSVRWTVITSYIEPGGNPAKNTEFRWLNLRFHRGASAETFDVGASEDASGTYAAVRVSSTDESEKTISTNGEVHGEVRLKRTGALAQFRLRGLSSTGDPQIVRAVAITELRDGAKP